ncbi:acyltransferase [Pantoea sp. MBD-2R]|uniref:acyltransferase family protein n=1 Tax=unclassified Pantoea TaxID=2630326 RepID=UPI0011BE2EC0|nr:acyltransferase [Pantoea sp. CCBC3-3-1]
MRIKHLDGMRGLAILLVIGFHAYSRWSSLLNFATITKNFPLFSFGYLGVPLFFMISGFVIFMTLDKSKGFVNFMLKRWLRLFPAMVIVSLLVYFTAHLFAERPGGIPSPSNLIPGLLFIDPLILKYIIGYHINGLEGSFWSLYVEAVFYIVIGAVYFTAGRKYCLPSLLLPMLLVAGASAFKSLGHPEIADFVAKFGFIHYSWFMIGCLLYERMNNRDVKFHYALVCVAVLINFAYYVKNTGPLVIIPLVLAIILFTVSFYSSHVQRFLSTKLLTAVGFSSYALYLIHENLMIASLRKIDALVQNDYVMLIMPVLVVSVIYCIAFLITKYAEPFLRNILKSVIFMREKDKVVQGGKI